MASESKSDPAGRVYAPEDLFVSAKSVSELTIKAAQYLEGNIAGYSIAVTRNDGSTYSLDRTFTDFTGIYTHLENKLGDKLPTLPEQPPYPWFVKPKLYFGVDPRDFDALEFHRLELDNWAKLVCRMPEVSADEMWSSFLSPALRRDWPATTGPIDLTVHDLQHQTAVTEWWYWNMHFTGDDGKDYSAYFCVFAREKFINPLNADKYWGYAVHSAFVSVDKQRYYQRSILDIDAPGILKDLIDKDPSWDPMLKKAYKELLGKGELPLPDQLNDAQIEFDRDSKDLKFELLDCSAEKLADGSYHIVMKDIKGTTGFDVNIKPEKKPIRHGFNGVTKGHGGDDMFYYFVPRCSLTGTFHVEGGPEQKIAKGQAWYDHEFGGKKTEEEAKAGKEMLPYAWYWCAVQLDNGYDISMCYLTDTVNTTEPPTMFGKLVAPDSSVTSIEDATKFEPAEGSPEFASIRTFQRSPLHWVIQSEKYGLDLVMKAAVEDQELVSIINAPGYWEGRLQVTGTFRGKPITGLAFLERAGFNPLNTLNQFFKNVGKSVRYEVSRTFPDKFDKETALPVVARDGFEYYLDAVPFDVLHQTLVAPVRSVIDRGGKSWRSFAALACVEVVGGDTRNLQELLAMPEFLHVGSLIIDDIQDESEIRRGGLSCHKEFGVPLAINAGTASYFQFQPLLNKLAKMFSPATLLKCYDEYFLCLRAGHAGQALDIYGLETMMEEAVASGRGAQAEARVLATHRLKTAAPAGSLSRIGAILGGGTDEQIRVIGEYFEGVGTAFQIMDDVLNLRGLYTTDADRKKGVQLKKLGEDLEQGKVTIPLVKAITRLPPDEMRELWTTVKSKPQDPEVVWDCIQILEKCGAIDECVKQATDLVERSWAALDPLLPPSFHKIMLRSFGWFVIERNV